MFTTAGVHLCGGEAYAYCQQTGLREHGCEPVWLEHLQHGDAAEQAEAHTTEVSNKVYEGITRHLEKQEQEGR
jgi:hypothetical protein